MPKEKATSITINGIQFALPLKMKKDYFKKVYAITLEGSIDATFEKLTKLSK